jgi:hypothetical protein
MYLLIRHSVNFARCCAAFVLLLATQPAALALPGLTCDGALTGLFTPRRPLMGRYEVCTTRQPLQAVLPDGWTVENLGPLDAFGNAGTYDKASVARLYGGRRAAVARGWIQEDGHYESVTLISPYPDASFRRLEPGTLVIRFII